MAETKPRKKFVIIDGKSVFYRGYYAMPNLSTKEGKPTGGVFGFATMAIEVIKRLKPDYVAVAWDKPKTNIRKRLALYPEYKAGRKPAPADFYDQVPILLDLLKAFGWPLYELDDYEADDIMGTLAVQAVKKDLDTFLVTSDLDLLQIVKGQIHVYALKTGLSNIELYSPKTFEAKYGIKVEQFLDFKSIKGDSSDNIPGVPGIGEKGAVELLKQFKTLDGIYDNLDLIKQSTQKKLIEGKKLAYLSKQLAQIWTDAPIKLDLAEVDGSNIQPKIVVEMLQKLEFRTLANNLPAEIQEAIKDHRPDFHKSSVKTIHVNDPNKLSIINLKNDLVFINSLVRGKNGQGLLILAVSEIDGPLYILDFTNFSSNEIKVAIKDIFKNKKIIGYDLKNFLKVFIDFEINLPKIEHDIQIGAFLINPLTRSKTFTDLAINTVGYNGSGFENLDPINLVTAEPEIISIMKKIYAVQLDDLAKLEKVKKLAINIEWPIIPVLARMEHKGIQLDTSYLEKFSEKINDLINNLRQQIYGYADQEFNISSPSQLSEILFSKLKLPTKEIKKGKTSYSTDAIVLEKLKGEHPIIDLISQYREVTKLKNTYVDTLPKLVDESSRLHTSFNLTVAQTGRLSSADPNLQNIPIRTDLGKNIRNAFIAGKGNKLVSADYSQFELRLAAVLAKDKDLIEMFNRGADIHSATAAEIYGREQEDITKQMRRAAKVINFGIMYGMSPHGLTVATAMTHEQAVEFIDKYKELRKPLFDYMNKVKEAARDNGYVETLFGRRRPMPDIKSANFIIRSAAERAAINMPIQGTEADLMKLAMIKIDKLLSSQHNNCFMLLQIHDSILVECPSQVANNIGDLLKNIMENIYDLPVKLEVDVSIGNNWGEV